jgi:hypothetical protein
MVTDIQRTFTMSETQAWENISKQELNVDFKSINFKWMINKSKVTVP